MNRFVVTILGMSVLATSVMTDYTSNAGSSDDSHSQVVQSGSLFAVGGGGLDNGHLDQWSANERPGESEVSDEVAVQGPLLAAAGDLDTGLEELGWGDEGLVGVDWEAEAIDLYWSGDLPTPVASLVSSFASEFPVRVRNSALARDDLHRASLRLLDAIDSVRALSDVAGVGIKEDLTGLRIFTTREDVDQTALKTAIGAVLPDVPLEFVYEPWAAENQPAVAGFRFG